MAVNFTEYTGYTAHDSAPDQFSGKGKLVKHMDEATHVAFEGVNGRIDAVSHDVRDFRKDFSVHVDEDRQMRDQVKEWSGQISVLKWLASAILTAMIAHVVRHW